MMHLSNIFDTIDFAFSKEGFPRPVDVDSTCTDEEVSGIRITSANSGQQVAEHLKKI
jgi:hypothetical protein